MLISWFTIIAQIFNFLLLIFLLNKFLYKPIVNIMEQRENSINQRLKQAKETAQAADKEKEIYQQKNQELKDQREDLITKAEQQAQDWRNELRKRSRKEIEELQAQWRTSLEKERASFLINFKEKAGQKLYQVLKHILKDIANRDLEAEIIKVFAAKLKAMSEKEKDQVKTIFKDKLKDQDRVKVYTGKILSTKLQQEVQKLIQEQFALKNEIEFLVGEDIILGIELRVSGYKLSWNIDNYLQELVDELSQIITAEEETKLVEEEIDG